MLSSPQGELKTGELVRPGGDTVGGGAKQYTAVQYDSGQGPGSLKSNGTLTVLSSPQGELKTVGVSHPSETQVTRRSLGVNTETVTSPTPGTYSTQLQRSRGNRHARLITDSRTLQKELTAELHEALVTVKAQSLMVTTYMLVINSSSSSSSRNTVPHGRRQAIGL